MKTLSLYYGGPAPMIARGEHQCNLLKFAEKNKGWHTFANDRITKRAVTALEKKGYLEVVGNQFKLKTEAYNGKATISRKSQSRL